jgi:pentatricopeptide repeat protein
MLRCGLATRDAVRKHLVSGTELASCSHQVRGYAAQWQPRGGSKTKSATTRIKKTPSRLDMAERETHKEIRDLKAKLATREKVAETKAAQETMGELDEETLEMIYTAINAPDPSTPEELRLETRRRKKLSVLGDKVLLSGMMRGDQMLERLAALDERLLQLSLSASTENEVDQAKAYDRATFLLGSLGVPGHVTETDERTMTSKAEASDGIALVSNANAREQMLRRVETLASILDNGPRDDIEKEHPLPLGIATRQEWEALAMCFAHAGEMASLNRVFKAVEQSGHGNSLLSVVNAAADMFAHQSDVEKCQALIAWITEKGLSPNDYTHHCLVKSFLRSGRLDRALDLISQLEEIQPAGLATYTMTLSHLLRSKVPAIQSKVWPLFNRMRLVAHPVPDAPCYAVMIRACALGIPQVNAPLWKPGQQSQKTSSGERTSDTERGLDFFREMTSRYGIRPDVEVYSALIDCCAGREDTYEKAWQLFRNMVEMERHREGSEGDKMPSLAPTRKIFNALLVGCRRNADLLRARWVLAEMLRAATMRWQELISQGKDGEEIEAWKLRDIELRRPDERTITDIFLTYAKYVPPVRSLKMASGGEVTQSDSTAAEQQYQEEEDQRLTSTEQDETQQEDEDTMTYNLPITKQALWREASSLMERIKIDYQQQSGLLSSVKPSLGLLNAYLRVLAMHAPRSDLIYQLQQTVFGKNCLDEEDKSLFDLFKIEANGWTYMALLQILSSRGRADGVLNFSRQIWEKFTELSGDGDLWLKDAAKATSLGLTKDCISNTWAAMLRILANYGKLDESMALLRRFAELYPPLQSVNASAKGVPQQESQSSSLLSPIRGDDIIRLQQKSPRPPKLDFHQLRMLHMRLVESEDRQQDIAFIKWLTMSYNPTRKMPFLPSSASSGQKQVRRFLAERIQSQGLLSL